jgi:hypothetical protein
MIPYKIHNFPALSDHENDHQTNFWQPSIAFIEANPGFLNIRFRDKSHIYFSGIFNKQKNWSGEQKIQTSMKMLQFIQQSVQFDDLLLVLILEDNVNSEHHRAILEDDFIPLMGCHLSETSPTNKMEHIHTHR